MITTNIYIPPIFIVIKKWLKPLKVENKMKQKLKSAGKVLSNLESLVKKGRLIRIRLPREEPDLIADRLLYDVKNWQTISVSREVPYSGPKVPIEIILKHVNTGVWFYWGSMFAGNNYGRYGLNLYSPSRKRLKEVRKLLYEPRW